VGIPGDVVTLKIWDAGIKINQAKDFEPSERPSEARLDDVLQSCGRAEARHNPGCRRKRRYHRRGLALHRFRRVRAGVRQFCLRRGVRPGCDVGNGGGVSKGRTVNVVTFGLEGVNVFFGAGPYFQDTTNDGHVDGNDTVNPDAVGLLLKNVSMAVAIFKPTAGLGNYYAVMVRVRTCSCSG